MTSSTQIKCLERTITALLLLAIAPYLSLLLFDTKSIITVIAGGVAMIVLFVVFQLVKKLRYLKLVEFERQGHIEFDDRPDVLSLTLLEPMSDKTSRRIRHAALVYCHSNKKPLDIIHGSRQHARAKKEWAVYHQLIDSNGEATRPLPKPLFNALTTLHTHYQKKPEYSYGRSAFYQRDLRLLNDLFDDIHDDVSVATKAKVDESIALLSKKLHDVQHHINEQKDDNLVVAADLLSADGRYY